jgi:signal transduction histidine kinase/ligand-binding sensor domain-containing protein
MRALHLLCVAFGIVGCAAASAAPPDITEYAHTSFGAAQGAPDKVIVIAQTSDGFLWLGTGVGLYRFDGVRFERISAVGGVPLLGEGITALSTPPSGGLWIGYQFGGASFLDSHGVLRNFPPDKTGVLTGATDSFTSDADGVVWAGTSHGLARFEGHQWTDVTQAVGLPEPYAAEVMADKSGNLWIMSGDKVALLRRGSSRVHVYELSSEGRFRQDSHGRVWAHMPNPNCLYLLDATRDDIPPCRRVPAPTFWLIDRAGGLWLESATSGVSVLPIPSPDGELALGSKRQSPADPQLLFFADRAEPISAFEDREGNIWFGTTLGLEQLRLPRLRRHGPFEDTVVLGAGNHNSLWVAVATTHIGPAQGDDFFQMKDGLMVPYRGGPTQITASYRDATGALWVSGYGRLWKLNDSTWEEVGAPPRERANPPGDSLRRTQAIARDAKGDLWLSLVRVGLFRLRDRQWELVPVPGFPAQEFPLAIYPDADGSVWLGYSRGRLASLTHDAWRVYTEKDGLNVRSVQVLGRINGQLWIGGDGGLQRIHNGRFESIPGLSGLGTVKGLLQANNGDLWLSTSIGGVHVSGQELRRLDAAPGGALAFEKLGTLDGMPGVPFAVRPLPTVLETDDGRIWFEADDRFSSIDPNEHINSTVAPNVIIGAVTDDGRQREPAASLTLFPNVRNVAIDYTATSLSIPSRVRFKYRLENFDQIWQDVGNRRIAHYNNLSPGRYVFHVIAANDEGLWNMQGATVSLIVPPLFYQTLPFRIVVIALAILLLCALFYIWLRQVTEKQRKRLEQRMEDRLDERTRIARELHDTLLQGFQALLLRFQTASDLLPGRPDEAKRVVVNAVDQAAQAITEGREAVQGLRDFRVETTDFATELHTLGRLAAAETDRDSASVCVEVKGTPRILDPIVRDEIYRIAGEALRNALRHANATRIALELTYETQHLRLAVRDDGKGVEARAVQEGRPGHFGLRGMRERAKLVDGKLDVWSGPNLGTEVELSVPGSRAYLTPDFSALAWITEWLSGIRARRRA